MTNQQAIARLQACHELLVRIDRNGKGIYYQPSEAELKLLQGFEEVANEAAERADGEGWFDEIRHRAGMAPSSTGLLLGVLRAWYASHLSPEAQVEHLKRALARRWGTPTLDE
jgi:hypothetical protein